MFFIILACTDVIFCITDPLLCSKLWQLYGVTIDDNYKLFVSDTETVIRNIFGMHLTLWIYDISLQHGKAGIFLRTRTDLTPPVCFRFETSTICDTSCYYSFAWFNENDFSYYLFCLLYKLYRVDIKQCKQLKDHPWDRNRKKNHT